MKIKIYQPDAGHMSKMAAMPIYGKNPSKIFFSGTSGQISVKLGSWYVASGTPLRYMETKINQHDAGHVTKMAVMPIYGINPLKFFFP